MEPLDSKISRSDRLPDSTAVVRIDGGEQRRDRKIEIPAFFQISVYRKTFAALEAVRASNWLDGQDQDRRPSRSR